jgi:protein-S-isoprenylcysteine O-methyltransferase Ste14
MSTLRTSIFVVWGAFWIYWLLSATTAKESSPRGSWRLRGVSLLIIGVASVVVRRLHGTGSLTIHNPVLEAVGTIVFLSGLSFAVWARIHLGRNWGMPMTERTEPELVTSGPYRYVRHPIYTGILLGLLGTALAINLYYLIALGVLTGYFVFSATVEERNMTGAFPEQYPEYKTHTKMLIPFVL